jgi:hypothetical protein
VAKGKEFAPKLRCQIQRNGKLKMETFSLVETSKRERNARGKVKDLLKNGYNARVVAHKTNRGKAYAVYANKK